MIIQRKRVAKRLASGLLAGALAFGGLALSGDIASATQSPTATRVDGIDRYATSAIAATTAFPSGSTQAVLVSGENFPDGLAAAALAGAVNAPVILTNPSTLEGSTGNAIAALGATTIHIVGGTSAVSANVEAQLVGLGKTVKRIGGADRYATADAVATTLGGLTSVGTYNSRKTAILVTGSNWPDALAAGGVAFNGKHPILLSAASGLSAGTKATLDSEILGIGRVIIVGGESAVPASVASEVAAIKNAVSGVQTAIDVVRVAGATRYDTAVELAKVLGASTVLNGFGWSITNTVLVSGENFYDALSAIALAGLGANDAMLLTGGSELNASTSAYLASKAATMATLQVVGGTGSVSDAVKTAGLAAMTAATPTVTISANQGATDITLTFSEKLVGTSSTAAPVAGTGIGLITNFKKNNGSITAAGQAAGVLAADEGLVTIAADGKSAVLTLGTALAVGDTITVVSGANAATADGRRIATTSVTVVADIVKPAVTTMKSFVGSNLALIGLSEPSADIAAADVSCGTTGGAATALTQYSTTDFYYVTCTNNVGANDVLTVAGTGWADLASNPPAKAYTSVATVDTTPAAIASATLSKTTHTQASKTTTGTGTFKVTANEAALPGPLGNLWTLQVIDNDAAPAVVLLDTLARKLVVGADVDGSATLVVPSAQTVVNALNANAGFAALFTATVTLAGAVDTVEASASFAGGQSVYVVDIQMTETVIDATFVVANFDTDANGDATLDGASDNFNSTAVGLTGTAKSTITVTSYLGMLVPGLSKMSVSTAIRDIAGNTPALAQAVIIN